MKCEHRQFKAKVAVNRITDEGGKVTNYSAAIDICCIECGVQFEFVGVPFGYSPYRPTTGISGLTLEAPITPPGEKPAECLPSMSVKISDFRH